MTVLPRGRPTFDAQDEGGAAIGPASTLNFVGAGVSVAYNAAQDRFDVTIPGSTAATYIQDTDADTKVETEKNADEDKVRITTFGTLRALFQTASPHIDLTGDVRYTGNLGGGALSPSASEYMRVGDLGTVDGVIGFQAAIGAASTPTAGVIVGIGGRALGKHASTVVAYGLDFVAGVANLTMADAYGARTQVLATGSGKTLTNYYGYYALPGNVSLATLTNWYGFYAPALTVGATLRCPFFDAGTTASGNNRGNVFKSNTQLFQTTMDFGGGAGVLGIGVAVTAPTTNPTGGMIVYVDPADNKLKARGQAGTVTVLANP